MTDRELLEKAAKAAGMDLDYSIRPDGKAFYHSGRNSLALLGGEWFSPMNDDGDALRLAVKLRIRCEPIDGYGVAYSGGRCAEMFTERHGLGLDECAAQRRAIVRAAAAMATQE